MCNVSTVVISCKRKQAHVGKISNSKSQNIPCKCNAGPRRIFPGDGGIQPTFKTEISHCLAIGYETGLQTSLWILVCVHGNIVMTSLLCEKKLLKILKIDQYILVHTKKRIKITLFSPNLEKQLFDQFVLIRTVNKLYTFLIFENVFARIICSRFIQQNFITKSRCITFRVSTSFTPNYSIPLAVKY